MADRKLVTYEESRNEHGPYWTLEIERSAAGPPGLMFTIKHKPFDPKYAGNPDLDQEMTIFVNDGFAVLAPVLSWLEGSDEPSEEDVRELVRLYQEEWERRDPPLPPDATAREQLDAQFRFRLARRILAEGYRKIEGEG